MVYRHVFYESNSRPWYRYWYRCVLRRNQPYSDFFKKFSVSDHPYFVGVQYHPEFTSRPIKPSPPYLGLLLASAGKLQSYLQKGCRLSPRWVNGVHLLHSPPVNGCSSLFFFMKVSLCSRDTYSDRSGSSTPDSEISELKLPSISNEWGIEFYSQGFILELSVQKCNFHTLLPPQDPSLDP